MLPFVLIPLAVISGAGGLERAYSGLIDLVNSKELTDEAKKRNEENINNFTDIHDKLQNRLCKLGEQEFKINAGFKYFVEAFEMIKNRPEFEELNLGYNVPKFDFNEIKTTSIATGAFLGAIVGATGGTVFGAAASVGTTSAVMALGTASTGTAISTLSGAAAVNATLAALGGGAIAAGGGGIAFGLFVLNSATLGIGLLVSGTVFSVAGSKVRKQADEVFEIMLENEKLINSSIEMLVNIAKSVKKLKDAIIFINDNVYIPNVRKLCKLVEKKTDWNFFTEQEKLILTNNILVVSILHKLINTAMYKVTATDDEGNITEFEPNTEEVDTVIESSLSEVNKINK